MFMISMMKLDGACKETFLNATQYSVWPHKLWSASNRLDQTAYGTLIGQIGIYAC